MESMKHIGKNQIFFNGRIITGPKEGILIILALVLSYITIISLWMYFISSMFYSFLNYLVIILFFLTNYYYIRCYVSDPGIIPRSHPKFIPDEEMKIGIELTNEKETTMTKSLTLEARDSNTWDESANKRVVNMFSSSNDDPILFNNKLEVNTSAIVDVIPSIFTKRICTTCNIVRPSKTSHCRICDNCVQNFDQ